MTRILVILTALMTFIANAAAASDKAPMHYGVEEVDGVEVFYRAAGDPKKPALVLLHGFPSSSHQYRNLMRNLSNDYFLIAPDYPGFGASAFPSREEYTYSFDSFADTIDGFLQQKGLKRYSLMVQDYGAPVGFRIARKHPERVQAIIVSNGNIYEEGVDKKTWTPILQLWEGRDPELEANIAKSLFNVESLRWQYTHGTRQPDAILPDNWLLDHQSISRPGQKEVQLDLFYDYRNNVALYPAFQKYLRDHQPPVLVVWGENDAFFTVPGAKALQRDAKDVELNFYNTGHFALEEDGAEIAEEIRQFLKKRKIR